MTISLGTLVERIQADVPPYNSVPSEAQYEAAVKDAILAYAQGRGRHKIEELSLVADQASYALPGDFVSLIKIARQAYESAGVVITSSGIVPTGALGLDDFQWYIEGINIIFEPAPTFDEDVELWFVAGFEDDGSGDYTAMLDRDAGILLLKATSAALRLQANKAAQEAWQYQIGDERVNKEKLSSALRAAAKAADDQYAKALEEVSSSAHAGMRARYDALGR